MEELFLSSAQGDSSLALPAEPARRPAARAGPKERSVRVQQQVQLTMARRARKSAANGKSCVFQLQNRFDNESCSFSCHPVLVEFVLVELVPAGSFIVEGSEETEESVAFPD